MTDVKWKSQTDAFKDALHYIKGRQQGLISSFITPWPKFNDASVGGIEWHSISLIAGRPAYGKSLVKEQLIREGIRLNISPQDLDMANYPIRVLDFSLEMLARQSVIREFSGVVNKSYKEVCSVGGPLTDLEIQNCHAYSKLRVKYPIDIVEDPPTVNEFIDIVHSYMSSHSYLDDKGVRTYKNTVMTLDHSLLLKKERGQNRMDCLYEFGDALTFLKRKYPIAFVILTQLNRELSVAERCEDGKIGNYVTDSDILGADALLQHSDLVACLNRPLLRKIKFFGPDRYLIEDESVIVMHFIKVRNGDPRMSFFKLNGQRMCLEEIETPPQIKKGR